MPPPPKIRLGLDQSAKVLEGFSCPVYTMPWPHGTVCGILQAGDTVGPFTNYRLSKIDEQGDQYLSVCVEHLGWINVWTRMNMNVNREPTGVNFAVVFDMPRSKAAAMSRCSSSDAAMPRRSWVDDAMPRSKAAAKPRRSSSDAAMPRSKAPRLRPHVEAGLLAQIDERVKIMAQDISSKREGGKGGRREGGGGTEEEEAG